MSWRFVALLAVTTTCLANPSVGLAQKYTFRKVVDLSDGYTAIASRPAINNSGTVVFGAAKPGEQGIFSITKSGQTTPIALLSQPYNGLGHVGGVDVGTPAINDSGQVAFFGFTMGGGGIFSSDGNSTTTIAHTNDLGINPTQLSDRVEINNAGNVAFSSTGSPSFQGVHVGNGGPIMTIDPMGSHPSINNGGVVAYAKSIGSDNPSIVTSDSRRIVSFAENAMQSTFPSINNAGVVAFQGIPTSTNNPGIYSGSGVPLATPAVPDVTQIADGSGLVTAPGANGALAINDDGTIAFWSELSGTGGGIFTGPDPINDKVIADGDELLGGTVNLVNFSPHGLNDRNQIVFSAQYTKIVDGSPFNSRGIFVAESTAPQVITLPGDYNGDDRVDAADYVVWRDNIGQVVVLPNDSTSGTVTQDDYLVWKANFGTTLLPGLSTAVPEPSAILQFALAILISIRTLCRGMDRRGFGPLAS